MVKADKHWINKDVNNLFGAILSLNGLIEAQKFFRDLLTEKELQEFAARWKVVQMLAAGISYIEIEKQTGMSSTTIARISHWLENGAGGYKLMLKKLKI
jgi:TrpR-related protein YerC/YecD